MPERPLTPEQRIKQLEAELQAAQRHVKEAEKKAQFFEAVVDVLEKDYGVSVKKQLGKSSRKTPSAD